MKVLELISKKRNGLSLSRGEIAFLINSYTEGVIPDYQMAAFLMAVYFQGMNDTETSALTRAMAYSGKIIDLKSIKGPVIDKHSTGGVGDGLSLVLAPLVAAAGVPILMMSGRGLGHTGGTLDKLESIPGFKTSLSSKQAIKQVQDIGIAMIGQTEELAPADKKIYALRDATATVENISLICASILSKKIASGINGLVLDVKCGNGAFMPDFTSARKLAQILVKVGKENGLKIKALITDMNQPLGKAIGNSLEIEQALEVLKGKSPHLYPDKHRDGFLQRCGGKGPEDFVRLTLALGAEMLMMGKKAKSILEAKNILQSLLNNGKALNKFYQMLKAQGGKIEKLTRARQKLVIKSPKSGFIYKINTKEVGLVATLLGAGRQRKEDAIDYTAGIVLKKKLGDKVHKGEILATFYFNQIHNLDELKRKFISAFVIKQAKPTLPPLTY